MKKHLPTLAALPCLLLLAAHTLAAAPTAELKVKGNIQVPSCTIAAPDNGVYDFGKLSSSLVRPSATTQMGNITKSWVITCDSQTYLTITPTDNRSDSVVITNPANGAPNHYGLGFVNGTGKIGAFKPILLNTSTVDGVAVALCKGVPGQCLLQSASTYISQGNQVSWATADNVLQAGRVFQADIRAQLDLASVSIMNGAITDNAKLDGSMTLNFAFAI
ncbi:hypothetical protein Z042_13885 [Chania multitudinisentens RB-25]|uniref:Fimbrial protein n=1 Tax=Chania multitudinisentens RB-25 TaxID=1441930 RepID=W0L9U7_9GAMM|nr:DUF1120 domain-containing protein [Chania multitudinisentens]AHG20593.1 hypothetical protein Z042_13885 [Chania multitudinisentens RB-25]